MAMTSGQRIYRDRLFNFIFGGEEHREWTLSLYNAVNETHYTDPSLIEFTTIRETLYLGMHNDVSFLISPQMNLYEQQSSFNPNMPLRLLQYTGNLYERFVTERKKNKYGRTLILLPVPRLVVFYNGTDDKPDEMSLYLSDAFPPDMRDQSDIQVHVRMINVNRGHSPNLLTGCRPLGEYAWIVDAIRTNEIKIQRSENMNKDRILETAISRAIDEIPDDFITKPFLEAHRAEVMGMLLNEYNEAKAMELFREEGRAEGKTEGKTEAFSVMRALRQILRSLGRDADFDRAIDDPAFMDQLIAEFQLG
jgi:hypothetical protein